VLRVHTDDLPFNALLDFSCQTNPSLPRDTQSFFAVQERRDVQSWQFMNLGWNSWAEQEKSLINIQCYQPAPLLVWLQPQLAASELEAQLHMPLGVCYTPRAQESVQEHCWFFITSCSTAENTLSVQNGSNKLQLDRMQSVHPIQYEFLDDGFDHIKAFRVLSVGLSSHHWVIIEDSWSVKM